MRLCWWVEMFEIEDISCFIYFFYYSENYREIKKEKWVIHYATLINSYHIVSKKKKKKQRKLNTKYQLKNFIFRVTTATAHFHRLKSLFTKSNYKISLHSTQRAIFHKNNDLKKKNLAQNNTLNRVRSL